MLHVGFHLALSPALCISVLPRISSLLVFIFIFDPWAQWHWTYNELTVGVHTRITYWTTALSVFEISSLKMHWKCIIPIPLDLLYSHTLFFWRGGEKKKMIEERECSLQCEIVLHSFSRGKENSGTCLIGLLHCLCTFWPGLIDSFGSSVCKHTFHQCCSA